jgi:hypothetical protein
MDDMMNMSFDRLRGEVAPASQTMLGGGGGSAMLGGPVGGGSALLMMGSGSTAPRRVEVPDHPMELRVLFFGPGARGAAAKGGSAVQEVDARTAAAACEGKRDFILFEPLDAAAKENRRLVLVLPLSAGPKDVKQAQVYLASSLASWLKEQKTDGSGRPYGECKDEDPTLRKHFTRAQILAIRAFGDEDGS